MHTDQIYIARDGKSGMHVLVRILAVDDIGVDYPPIDPDNFNKLMMARDVKSLALAAPAGRQIKQTEDTGFETPTKPHGILGRLKGLFDKFRK